MTTLMRNTTSRVYNDLRIQSMKEFDSVLCSMSEHNAARPACAPIQGKVVCIVPKSDPRCKREYPNIYDYGYGTPAGTQGVNCGHDLSVYIEGVSQPVKQTIDPEQAVKNMKIQQKQRYYERQVRHLKGKKSAALKLNDHDSASRFQAGIRGYQAKLRQIVKDHDFLTRQYNRERIIK